MIYPQNLALLIRKKKLADVHATSPLPVVNLSKNKLKSNKEKQNDSSAIYYQFLDKQQNKTEKVEKKSDLVISSVGKKNRIKFFKIICDG